MQPSPANPIVVEFDGRTPLVSDVSAHLDGDERIFVEVRDFVYRANRRLHKRNGKAAIGASAGARITTLHSFTHYDASGVPTYMKYRAFGTAIEAASAAVWSAMTFPSGYVPTSAAPWSFANHNARVFGVNGNQAMVVSAGLAASPWREVGQVAPLVAPAYSLTANDPPVTSSSTGTTVSATVGSAVVNCTGASFVTGVSWVGKRITINGRNYEIAAVGATNQLTLTEGFKEDTAAGMSWSVYPGVGDWEDGPQYAFAFYNPTTGHISNSSPVVLVTEKKQVGRTITLTITGSAAINAAYDAGYTQLQLFRTASNGAQLVALNEKLASNNTTTNITYVETAVKFADTYLTKLPADQVMRRKPVDASGNPLKFIAIASYKGRLWAITRDRLYWCASLDEVPLWQVPEECWPAQFSRYLPEAFGLVVIGQEGYNDRLVIQTADGDYTVEGYDNRDIEVFPLRRRPSGGFAGGATVADGRLVELYRDRRLLDGALGDIAAPIQNRLNDIPATLTTTSRLHWFSLNHRDYLVVSMPGSSASTDNDTLLIYDYSLGKWSETVLTPGISAMTTVKDANGSLELWVGDTAGNVWRISDAAVWQDAGANFAPRLKTAVLRFGRRVALAHAQAFVSDGAVSWTLKMFLDEQTSEGAPAIADKSFKQVTLAAARHQNQSAQGRELEWVPILSDRASAEAFQFALAAPATAGELWVEKIRLTFNVTEESGGQS